MTKDNCKDSKGYNRELKSILDKPEVKLLKGGAKIFCMLHAPEHVLIIETADQLLDYLISQRQEIRNILNSAVEYSAILREKLNYYIQKCLKSSDDIILIAEAVSQFEPAEFDNIKEFLLNYQDLVDFLAMLASRICLSGTANAYDIGSLFSQKVTAVVESATKIEWDKQPLPGEKVKELFDSMREVIQDLVTRIQEMQSVAAKA